MTRARRGVLPLALAVGLAVACLLPLTAAAAPLPAAGLGIRLLEAPTDRQDDPRARSYVVDQVRPGAAFTRRVEVRNDTDSPASLLVYPAPATIRDGAFVVGGRGEPGVLPSWVSVSPSVLELPARGSAQVSVVVRVPADAATGEQLGAVVVEQPPTGGEGLAISLRTAVRVYLSVGPGEEPVSDLAVDGLVPARSPEGAPQVRAVVRNTGERALDVTSSLVLSDGPDGRSAGPFPAATALTLAPGQSGEVVVDLDPTLPAGPWTARLDARSGRLERSVSSVGLVFPGDPGTTGPAVPVVAVADGSDGSDGSDGLGGGSGPLAVGVASLLAVGVAMAGLGHVRSRRVDEELARELADLLEPAARQD